MIIREVFGLLAGLISLYCQVIFCMLLTKNQFFSILFAALLTPFLVYKLAWLSGTVATTGKMRFMGKTISGQITSVYPVISFLAANDTVWFNGTDNELAPGAMVPVRYRKDDVHDARINSLSGIWMDSIIIAGIPTIMLLLIYLHREIFPRGTRFMIGRRPFIRVLRE